MGKKILIVDDEERMRLLLSDFLCIEGYRVLEAKNGNEALNYFYTHSDIALIVLDVMMPEMDGFRVCEEIRSSSNVPILLLTAMSSESDEISGLKLGADEYIRKPFSPSILMLRINKLIERVYGVSTEIIKGELKIDSDKKLVWINNKLVDLSQTEYKLLHCLVQNERLVLSREQLLDNVWGYQYVGTDRTVDTHMNRLRFKMQETGRFIKTVRGVGYLFEVVE